MFFLCTSYNLKTAKIKITYFLDLISTFNILPTHYHQNLEWLQAYCTFVHTETQVLSLLTDNVLNPILYYLTL